MDRTSPENPETRAPDPNYAAAQQESRSQSPGRSGTRTCNSAGPRNRARWHTCPFPVHNRSPGTPGTVPEYSSPVHGRAPTATLGPRQEAKVGCSPPERGNRDCLVA
ncbi:predicted protein [Streptomyces sp. AA4]|nr:predicted protein [Streptomyces sp. AA4]